MSTSGAGNGGARQNYVMTRQWPQGTSFQVHRVSSGTPSNALPHQGALLNIDGRKFRINYVPMSQEQYQQFAPSMGLPPSLPSDQLPQEQPSSVSAHPQHVHIPEAHWGWRQDNITAVAQPAIQPSASTDTADSANTVERARKFLEEIEEEDKRNHK